MKKIKFTINGKPVTKKDILKIITGIALCVFPASIITYLLWYKENYLLALLVAIITFFTMCVWVVYFYHE